MIKLDGWQKSILEVFLKKLKVLLIISKSDMFIYKIENLVNNKVYIGQTVHTINFRYKGHLRNAENKKCHPLYNSMNKYGIDNFELMKIEQCISIEELNNKEIFWIDYFKSQDREFGYNLDSGGKNGKHCKETVLKMKKNTIKQFENGMPKETKRKIGLSTKGKKHSKETKLKMSIAQKKYYNILGNKRIISEETKKKISDSLKGRFFSKETRKKLSIALKGRKKTKESILKRKITMRDFKHSEETKKKMSNTRKGRKFSEKHKRNLTLSLKKRWKCIKEKQLIGGEKNEKYFKT